MSNPPRSPPKQIPNSERFTLRQGAKALVTSASKILLVREHHADGSPFWTLPGGGVHVHEDPVEALQRELDEELNCRASITDPVTRFWYAHESLTNTVSMYIVYECSLLSDPDPNPDEGVYDCRWVSPGALPSSTLPQVRQVCQHVSEFPVTATVTGD